nr:PREDICTED: nucleoporin NUP116/NSP116-like [Linepithema humile]
MVLTSIKNMHIYIHLLFLVLATRTLASPREYRRESNNVSLPVNSSKYPANKSGYLIENELIIIPIFEGESSEFSDGSQSNEIGGNNGTTTNSTMELVPLFLIVDYSEEEYGNVSNSSENRPNNGGNGTNQISNRTSISQNQQSNRTSISQNQQSNHTSISQNQQNNRTRS